MARNPANNELKKNINVTLTWRKMYLYWRGHSGEDIRGVWSLTPDGNPDEAAAEENIILENEHLNVSSHSLKGTLCRQCYNKHAIARGGGDYGIFIET